MLKCGLEKATIIKYQFLMKGLLCAKSLNLHLVKLQGPVAQKADRLSVDKATNTI